MIVCTFLSDNFFQKVILNHNHDIRIRIQIIPVSQPINLTIFRFKTNKQISIHFFYIRTVLLYQILKADQCTCFFISFSYGTCTVQIYNIRICLARKHQVQFFFHCTGTINILHFKSCFFLYLLCNRILKLRNRTTAVKNSNCLDFPICSRHRLLFLCSFHSFT